MPQEFKKDPEDILDYCVDWSLWMAEDDAIASSSWSADDGITIMSTPGHLPYATATAATVWLSGGEPTYVPYKVTNTIVTLAARMVQRSIRISVHEL